MTSETIEHLAEQLSSHPDYRVLRRLKLDRALMPEETSATLARGVVVDTETTDLDPGNGKIIEIGLVAFDYDPATGRVVKIIDAYGALEDPGYPLIPTITEITGITDAMLSGQRIDDARVASLLDGARLVVAHNAAFDRPFLENRFPIFSDVPWGCSLADIDWHGEGVGSRKLDYIAYRLGFFYEAHRAEEDCRALLGILSRPLPVSGRPALASIIERLPQSSFTVEALGSPFATKDLLKQRQYRWDSEQKVWHRIVVGSEALVDECAWLKVAVYGNAQATIGVTERDACSRFSRRALRRKMVLI